MSTMIMLTAMALGLPPAGELTGIVRDDAGRPRPGVLVWVAAGPRGDGTVPALAQTTTDSQGRFTLPVPPLPPARPNFEPLAVWTHAPGAVPARRSVDWASQVERAPIELTLAPAEEHPIRLVDADGKPAAGARVRPRSFNPGADDPAGTYLGCPDELAERLATVAAADGAVVLAFLGKPDQAELEVSAPGLGTQSLFTMQEPAKPIALSAVGRVSGRVTADDPEAVRGLALTLRTKCPRAGQREGKDKDEDAGQAQIHAGVARVRTDDQGRFEVPALAAGEIFLQAEVPAAWPYRLAERAAGKVEAGRENTVNLVLQRAVRIVGSVRARASGQPVAGVSVGLGGMLGEVVTTDAEGRFAARALPGASMARVIPWATPRPFFAAPGELPEGVPPGTPVPQFAAFDIPADTREFTLAPFELIRGDDLEGRVVDGQNHPVAAARVEARVVLERGKVTLTTQSDADGRFVLRGLDPARTSMGLEASTDDARTHAAVELAPAAAGPVVLRIRRENLVTPAGRVVDEAGRPLAGAEVEIWSQEREYDEPARLTRGLPTGPDGTYRSDRPLRIDWRYRVHASAAGRTAVRSDWVRFTLTPAQGPQPAFPDLVLAQPRALAGRMLDRQGRPVAGALVRSVSDDPARPEARTDAHGQFRLEGGPAGPAFLFAEAPGFRFQGWPIDSHPDPVGQTLTFTLTRPGEPPDRPLTTLPEPVPEAEANALARMLIAPQLQSLRAGKWRSEEQQALEVLSRIDPAHALELLDDPKLPAQDERAYRKVMVAHRLLRQDPDDALAIIEAASDPWLRADGYRRASDLLPLSERAKKEERLTQALLHARAIQDPEMRLAVLGRIAGRWLALGATARAKELFAECQTIARALPTAEFGGYARGVLAEELAELDLPAALELIRNLDDASEFDRHHGNIAHRMAGRNPAEAERIWGLLKAENREPMRDGMGQRVCYRMAPIDRARAHRIALRLSSSFSRAYALGMMADALSARDKAAAAALLDEAVAHLAAGPGAAKDAYRNGLDAAADIAVLLPTVEKIDPGRVSEVLWRALSLRGPRRDAEFEEVRRLGADAVTAMMVSRYDRTLARTLLEPVLARLPGLIAGGVTYLPESLFAAPVLIDPHRAVALVERLPRSTDPDGVDGNRQRFFVAERLTYHGAERWRGALQDAGFWDMDGYDLGNDD